MRDVFFLSLLAAQASQWKWSREGFMRLELTDGVPKVLYILQFQEGIVQKKLAEVCQIKESTIAVILKRMQEQNMIYKVKVLIPSGKRAFAIYLTDAGKKKAKEVSELMTDIDARALADFSEEEKECLYSFLERIRNNLES